MKKFLIPMLMISCTGPSTDDTGPVETDADADADADSDADADTDTDADGPESFTFDSDTVTVDVADEDTLTRTYTLTTTHDLRDDLPAGGTLVVTELPDQMVLRSGNTLVDALFAVAMQEVRDNSVSAITDGAFDNGNPVDCDCFETGEKWKYVWTRDTAYAVHLGLGLVDPERARNSLGFKISERKASVGGGQLEIVQDTGTGGSWPVSTDRVAWALGAHDAMAFTPYDDRTDFRADALEALDNTIEADWKYAFDHRDGLYRGEQSFLDWREQTYPQWTAEDTSHIAMQKSLSTNVLHFAALQRVTTIAIEATQPEKTEFYTETSFDLRAAIDAEFWDESAGLYRTYTSTELDGGRVAKYDWLGNALAVYLEVADENKAERIVENWPHTETGPPVYWPQQPLVPVYHNRGQWPFVTAYGVLAAARVGNAEVMDAGSDALIRGAALNLSNMENFEFIGQDNWHDDGVYSGPVVNSRRQLWSVAGFIGMVVKGWFGLRAELDGVSVWPNISSGLRNGWLADSNSLALYNVPLFGNTVDMVVELPPAGGGGGGGMYSVSSSYLDGAERFSSARIREFEFTDTSVWSFELTAATGVGSQMTVVPDVGDFRDFWSPRDPNITDLSLDGGQLSLTYDAGGESGVVFNVFRDGVEVASGLTDTTWRDSDSADHATTTHCYAIETEFDNGHKSQHSAPMCWWGDSFQRVHSIPATAFTVVGGTLVDNHGREHYEGWGDPAHTLTAPFSATGDGEHYVQLVYGNGAGPINTGITAAHKWVTLTDSGGTVVGEGPVVMPHLGAWDRWADSTLLPVTLTAGESYTVEVSSAPNMSWLQHFEIYTGGNGGGSEVYNDVNVAEIKVLEMGG